MVEAVKSGEPRKSLKAQNLTLLMAFLAVNLAVLTLAIKADHLSFDIEAPLKQWRGLLASAGGIGIVAVVNGLLSADFKARLVFWRWDYPLPGSLAFSKYIYEDTRINVAALQAKIGVLPSAAADQNALWYALYKSIRDDVAVSEAHKNYLLCRDYAGIAFLMLFVGGFIGSIFVSPLSAAFGYLLVLFLQYFITISAARIYGVRFVTTVLAIKSVT